MAHLCRQHHVAQLYVFGSATTSAFDPERSDIDLIVQFENQQLSPEDKGQRYWDFLEQLEKLLERPVDLLSHQNFSNPYFRQEVEETKILIYDQSQSQEILV
ncbi:nucleotidyltransferase family protein [Tunicatimonas sp.]|uniref:nucleotidyltransferase family protein n=1 Tax=Tunicatimonas sp. TaxID=1940096 RepID=UPI003C76A546